MALYSGRPHEMANRNYGPPANRCQRLMEVANPDQVLADGRTVGMMPSSMSRKFLGAHRLRDLSEAEPVYQLSAGDFPPIRSLDSSLRRLPRPRTDTIGRQDAIEELTKALGEPGLLTLIGPGGVGKTRLALEVAAEATLRYARDSMADGLVYCDLAVITDPATLPEFVAAELEIPQRRDETVLEAIVDHLRHRRSLVILDNCEHLLDMCVALVSTILARCVRTVVLATSRAPLDIPREQRFHVGPMSVPSPAAGTEDVATHDAVRLFLARAREVNPALSIGEEALLTIGQICRQVDGLPLAIELVASRCRVLSPAEIREALEHEPAMLPRDAPSPFQRQRTIENTIAWSYGLLEPEARLLMDVASAFAPEFSFAALREVGSEFVSAPLIPHLTNVLSDMSMLDARPGPDGTVIHVLETIRAFGRARLRESDPDDRIARRHASYFLRLAEQAGAGMWTENEIEWSERIRDCLANLREAASWARDREDWSSALGIPCALRNFGHYTGRYEIFGWAESAAVAARTSGHPLVPEAFGNAGFGRWLRNDLSGAMALAEEGLSVERMEAHPRSRQVRMTLMATALYQGDVDAAVHWGAEFIDVSDERGVTWLRSMARSVTAIIEFFHDVGYAQELAFTGLALADEIRNPSARCHALLAIGLVTAQDDPEGATKALAECVALSDVVGNQWTGGMSRVAFLRTQATLSDRQQALENAGDLLRHWADVGDWAQVWTTLQVVSMLLAERGRDREAVMVEAALKKNATAAYYQDPVSQQLAAMVESARQRLPAGIEGHARQLGSTLSEREVVEAILPVIDDELRTIVHTSASPRPLVRNEPPASSQEASR
jgi:predicted ATPase